MPSFPAEPHRQIVRVPGLEVHYPHSWWHREQQRWGTRAWRARRGHTRLQAAAEEEMGEPPEAPEEATAPLDVLDDAPPAPRRALFTSGTYGDRSGGGGRLLVCRSIAAVTAGCCLAVLAGVIVIAALVLSSSGAADAGRSGAAPTGYAPELLAAGHQPQHSSAPQEQESQSGELRAAAPDGVRDATGLRPRPPPAPAAAAAAAPPPLPPPPSSTPPPPPPSPSGPPPSPPPPSPPQAPPLQTAAGVAATGADSSSTVAASSSATSPQLEPARAARPPGSEAPPPPPLQSSPLPSHSSSTLSSPSLSFDSSPLPPVLPPPPSPAPCEEVLEHDANGKTCGLRITKFQRPANGGLSELDARARVAALFPEDCGACMPAGYQLPPPSPHAPPGSPPSLPSRPPPPVPPAPPLALLALLNAKYSTRLYGTPGQIDAQNVRVLWPELMSTSERAQLTVACTPPSSDAVSGPSLFYMAQFLQHNALWVHWSTEQLGAGRVPDHTWAEVTHCHYTGEKVSARTPMWFFWAPGAGLHVNIGRSLRTAVLTGNPRGDLFGAHSALMRGDVAEAAALLHVDLNAYDSVQFPNYHAPRWRGERFTEIVMLRMKSEADFITDHLPQMRCGPPGALRACSVDDEPVRQQSALCAGPAGEALGALFQQSGCAEPNWVSLLG